MALRNISDADPLRHNDDECRHQIVILFKVVNDAAPWSVDVSKLYEVVQDEFSISKLRGFSTKLHCQYFFSSSKFHVFF